VIPHILHMRWRCIYDYEVLTNTNYILVGVSDLLIRF
jgi:hypothetical protein